MDPTINQIVFVKPNEYKKSQGSSLCAIIVKNITSETKTFHPIQDLTLSCVAMDIEIS